MARSFFADRTARCSISFPATALQARARADLCGRLRSSSKPVSCCLATRWTSVPSRARRTPLSEAVYALERARAQVALLGAGIGSGSPVFLGRIHVDRAAPILRRF